MAPSWAPPAPSPSAPNGATGVTTFRYQLNAPVTTSSPSVAASGGVASAAITVNRIGVNTLFVKAYNAAGNPSAEKPYGFNTAQPAEPDQAGDFTGDGKPDIIGVGAGSMIGGLYLYDGNGAGLDRAKDHPGNRRLERLPHRPR